MGSWLLPAAAACVWAGTLGAEAAAGTLGLPPPVALVGGLAAVALAVAVAAAPRRTERPGVLAASGLLPTETDASAAVPEAGRVGGGAPRVALAAALVGFVLLGAGAWAFQARRLEASVLRRLADERVVVTGVLRSDPRPGRFGWSALAAAASVESAEGSVPLRETVWVGGEGSPPTLSRGDLVILSCTIEVPDDGFGDSLRRRGIAVAVRAEEVRRVGPSPNPVVRAAEAFRARIASSVGSLFPAREGGLLLGLAIGDERGLEPGLERDFRATGLGHLLVVSGGNLAIVLAPLLGLAVLLRLPTAARFVLGLATIGFFVALTGAEPSVLRAGVMTGLALTGVLLGRPRSAGSALAGAVLLLLLVDPRLAASVAFQLSVGATAGMVVLAGPFADRLGFLPRPAAVAAGATLAAQTGVFPLLLFHFREVPLVAIVANLVAIPAVAPAMLLGLGAVGAAAVFEPAGRVLAGAALVPLRYLEAVADRFASAPVAWVTSGGGLPVLVGGFALVGLLAWWLRARRRLPRAAVVGLLCVVPLVTWAVALRAGAPDELVIRFLDVGQGDAALISTPEGANVLVDGGPDEEAVATALSSVGVKRLDLVVASHPHADHIVGLPAVLARFGVGLLLEPGCPDDSAIYADLLAAAAEEGVPTRAPRAGETFSVGRLRLDVLSPDRCWIGTGSDPNNDALVLKATYGPHTVLFATEPEEPAQEAMLGVGTDLAADVLKVPHHGAKTSVPAFFEAVDADMAVVSVGPNPYGHPVAEVLAWIRDAGTRVLRTDRLGDITIRFTPRGPLVESSAR